MTTRSRTHGAVVLIVLGALLWSASGQAFRKVAVGVELPDVRLRAVEGGERATLDRKARVNLVAFFRPDQEYSRAAMEMLARICSAYKKRGVGCVAIVSDYYDKKRIDAAIKAAGWPAARTLIDKEDLYTNRLGVVIYPSIGIADGSRKLRAYEPFVKINYEQRIDAHVRFLLGDLNEKQLQNALAPPVQEVIASDRDSARSYYNFARRLFDSGKLDNAVEQAEHALSLDPGLADAQVLIGSVRARQKRCDEARARFQKALALDPSNKQAARGMARCKRP